MEFNFIEFLDSSKTTCRGKLDFAERIRNEVETVSEIKDERTYMDRLIYKHQLELTLLALDCGILPNKDGYYPEIVDLLDNLKD